MPSLFEHRTLGQWREAGSKTTRDRAREVARRRIAGHEYALPADVQRGLDRIYKHAEDHLV
jgi:trimethylamine:corrinoid methyltransferase-like protein